MKDERTGLRVFVEVRTRGGHCAWNCPYAQRIEGASPPQTNCLLFRSAKTLAPRPLQRDPYEGAFTRLPECIAARQE